jgi:hypothetical protein
VKAKRRNGIVKKKRNHLKIAVCKCVQAGGAGFERYRLVHNALPGSILARLEQMLW